MSHIDNRPPKRFLQAMSRLKIKMQRAEGPWRPPPRQHTRFRGVSVFRVYRVLRVYRGFGFC